MNKDNGKKTVVRNNRRTSFILHSILCKTIHTTYFHTVEIHSGWPD